ncbi:MAG: iron-containing alcohol dehydrogenase family protein [Candidatus Metalachnospira sp.]|nr:iron-containing alcohol dehydrogenase family protein [Candidatus Metalachnospira sp.]
MYFTNYDMILPDYSIGESCYKSVPYWARRYGKKAVVIGGKTAIEKSKETLLTAIKDSELEITDFIWYGGDSNYENVEVLKKNPIVQNADILFGVGGGRAIDTVKVLAAEIDKPVFDFPTIASNCAPTTSLSVMYNADGTFKQYHYCGKPVDHTFINTQIIAEAPSQLLWAGIGDALSKECESSYAAKGDNLFHTTLTGVCLGQVCTTPLVEYGAKALDDCRNNTTSYELQEVILSIIVSTGLVSNFTTNKDDLFYYNSSLAHAFYNGSTVVPATEKHRHGEIVSFGVLCLLAADKNYAELERIAKFNKSVGLPVTLKDVEVSRKDVDAIVKKATLTTEWKFKHADMSEEIFKAAILEADAFGEKI